jgi:hypothetical protein
MILALYRLLEIALFYSSIGRLAWRPTRSNIRRAATREFVSRASED